MTKIYAFVPFLLNEAGHYYEYHKAVTKASFLNGDVYIKLIPKNCSLSNLSQDFKKNLPPFHFNPSRKLWNHLLYPLSNFVPLFRLFRKNKKEKIILFAEDLGISHLFVLFLSFFVARPSISIWILQRYEANLLPGKGFFHKILYRSFAYFLKKDWKLLADTSLLVDSHKKRFQMEPFLLPIPHTQDCLPSCSDKHFSKKILWFPGSSTREEKGCSHIKRIASLLKNNPSPFCLLLSESLKNEFSPELQEVLLFTKSSLSRSQYVEWMEASSGVLLPYEANRYQYRSSGIFIESVCAGKIPFVSQGTWMAFELSQFNLPELIISSWNSSNLLDLLESCMQNKSIQKKFSILQSAYRETHSIENFAKTFQKLKNS